MPNEEQNLDSVTELSLKVGPELPVYTCQPGMLQFLTQQPEKLPVQEGGATLCRCGDWCRCGSCGGRLGCWCC